MNTFEDDPLDIPIFLRRAESDRPAAPEPARPAPQRRERWIMPKRAKRQRKTDEQRLGLRILGYSDKQASRIDHDDAECIIRSSISPARWFGR